MFLLISIFGSIALFVLIYNLRKDAYERKQRRLRQFAAQLWGIHHHLGEFATQFTGEDGKIIYLEEKLFPLLRDIGWDVRSVINTLTQDEIMDAADMYDATGYEEG